MGSTLLAGAPSVQGACPALLDHRLATLKGESKHLCEFSGQVLLIVNTASYCGFTPQYQGLEALYQKYRQRGFVVLGFPSNDFGRQEPGKAEDIADFCERRFQVRFPMFDKTRVAKDPDNPLYVGLAEATGQRPGWNFHKYLVDRSGNRVQSFSSSTEPQDAELVAQIEALLKR